VRRRLIRFLLPLVFCVLPLAAALLVAAALPPAAREFYFTNATPLDALIGGLGAALFVTQVLLSWKALQWRGRGFDERPDSWLTNLTQAAEWFPLLGLIGTVAGIMQTFATFGTAGEVVSQQQVIAKYASAITATCSGLFMALINILPGWIVMLGRDVIRALAGPAPAPEDDGQADDVPPARTANKAAVRR
jgi:hypothetical protein